MIIEEFLLQEDKTILLVHLLNRPSLAYFYPITGLSHYYYYILQVNFKSIFFWLVTKPPYKKPLYGDKCQNYLKASLNEI